MELLGCGRAWVRVRRERLRMRDIVGQWWCNVLSLMIMSAGDEGWEIGCLCCVDKQSLSTSYTSCLSGFDGGRSELILSFEKGGSFDLISKSLIKGCRIQGGNGVLDDTSKTNFREGAATAQSPNMTFRYLT